MPSVTPDRMLVAMIDVTGMSVDQIRSLEAYMRHYAYERYVSTNIYDGGPVSLRVCHYEEGEAFHPEADIARGWRPVEEADL